MSFENEQHNLSKFYILHWILYRHNVIERKGPCDCESIVVLLEVFGSRGGIGWPSGRSSLTVDGLDLFTNTVVDCMNNIIESVCDILYVIYF